MAEPTFFTPDMEASLRPRLETIFVNTRPMVSAATSPVAASPAMMQAPRLTAAEILNRARAAVLARRREQQQQGVVPYAPDNRTAADFEIRNRLIKSGLQQPKWDYLDSADGKEWGNVPELLQQRGGQSGGVIATFPGGERVVTGKYGSGISTSSNASPKTIEGMPAAKWFQEAANRQGQRIVVGGYDRGSIFEPKTFAKNVINKQGRRVIEGGYQPKEKA